MPQVECSPGHRQFRPRRLSADDAAVEGRGHRHLGHVGLLPAQLSRTRTARRDLLHPVFRRLGDLGRGNEDAVVGGALEVALVADAAVVFARGGVLEIQADNC